MTSPWRTFFSALCLAVQAAAAATVTGAVDLRDSRDPLVQKKKDYSGVVVWLQPAAGSAPVAISPRRARMVQKDKTFTPHVLAITVGSAVDFPNFDPIFHNAFSNYNGQLFDVGLYPPGSTRSVRFGRVGIVRVFCNIHASMSAIIAVLDTPYFAVTGKDGTFTLSAVPEGEYTFHVFHERSTAVTLDKLQRKVIVRSEPLTIPLVSVSESGYLAIPHKNKFGKDYPPAMDADGVYPAVRP